MESELSKRLGHKEWRRIAKRERRRRIRKQAARERDEEDELLQKRLESSSEYVEWKAEQDRLDQEQEKLEQLIHDKLERAWLEAEEKSQKEWKILQERKAKAREVQLAQEEKLREEFDKMQDTARKKKDAERRRRDEQKKMYERMKKEFDAYIDDGARTPKVMRSISETQPGKEVCPFFSKTGSCRYGDICSRNHQRPGLSKVIMVPNFYTHYSLERHRDDYDSDFRLEYDHKETRSHFRDFYFDVVPELEKFGKIRTLQYCKNTEPHLRGNLYVEYLTEREAASALRGLKGRWYAGRQLHCEFVGLKSWRGAICGMVRCPKGSACNFLHVFRNPTEDYGVKSPPLWQRRQEQFDRGSSRRSNTSSRRTNWEDDGHYDRGDRARNWRWSESPEPDDRRGRDRNFRPRGNFNQRGGRGGFDSRRNDRGFYQNRNPRGFNDRNRYSPDDRGAPKRFKRRYSESDNEEYGVPKMRRRERRSADKRSRSRSRYRTRSRSVSRSQSGSRSRSRSGSRSVSRSRSGSGSRSRSRSRSPPRGNLINVDELRKPKLKERMSPPREPKRRAPSPPPPRKGPPPGGSKWDSEKREHSSPDSRASRSVSPPPVRSKPKQSENHSSSRPAPKKSSQPRPPPSGKSKSGHQKEYEWDTTDSDN